MTSSDNTDQKESTGYSQAQIHSLVDKLRELRNRQPSVQLNLFSLSEQLTVQRAKKFCNEAMGRRLPVIERSVMNIYKIYPPDRSEFLSKEECTDIAVYLHAFAINVYAILDNAAWVCMLEAGGKLNPLKVGLYKKECQAFFPSALVTYVSEPAFKQWFNEYGKVYRDSTAHRIPPYLPDRSYSGNEQTRLWELTKESMQVLRDFRTASAMERIKERLARHEQIQAQIRELGRNSLAVVLALTGEDASPSVYLHPQLLSDWLTIQEFVKEFAQTMRAHYGWQAPVIPDMVVN